MIGEAVCGAYAQLLERVDGVEGPWLPASYGLESVTLLPAVTYNPPWHLKGTRSRDFRLLVFSMNLLQCLSFNDYLVTVFLKFCPQFAEIFEYKGLSTSPMLLTPVISLLPMSMNISAFVHKN